MQFAEYLQGFLVIAQGLLWLFDVHIPVADTIQTASMYGGIVEQLGEYQSLPEPGLGLRIISSRPQRSQVYRALPFCCAILDFAGSLQRPCVILLSLFKFAQ